VWSAGEGGARNSASHCLRYRKKERMGVRPSAISSAVPPLPSKNAIWRAG
jgi:hypothetical protein